MVTGSSDDEEAWSADKREFVADWRESRADQRDLAADERQRAADEREIQLERWKRYLEMRATGLGVDVEDEASPPTADTESGDEDADARVRAGGDRSTAAARRTEATEERHRSSPTLLAKSFATIAEQLYEADTVEEVFLRIARSATTTVTGCAVATITLRDSSGLTTAAFTDPRGRAADQLQYEAGEGPSLDALETPVVYAPAFPDPRWRALAGRPGESGVCSSVSYRLSAASPRNQDTIEGSLTLYGTREDAFDQAAQEIGLVLASHASIAIRVAAERTDLVVSGRDLKRALMSRDVIGQAKGILMERLNVSPNDAFDLLRRASQRLNVKLREVAAELTETGQLSGTDADETPGTHD